MGRRLSDIVKRPVGASDPEITGVTDSPWPNDI